MFGIHRGDLPPSTGQRLNLPHAPAGNSGRTHHRESSICNLISTCIWFAYLLRANFLAEASPLINLVQMAKNDACACFRWTFPSALSYLFFFLSGEHFYVSEFFYWHCNCLIFSISIRGYYFPHRKIMQTNQ